MTRGRAALLIGGWVLALAFFCLASAATLFLTPLGMRAWSVVAVPLAIGTARAMSRSAAERRRPALVVGSPWLALASAASMDVAAVRWPGLPTILDHEAAAPWVLLTYAVFPLFVSLVAAHALWTVNLRR